MNVALWCDIYAPIVNVCHHWNMLGQNISQTKRSGCILSAFPLFVYFIVSYAPFWSYLCSKKCIHKQTAAWLLHVWNTNSSSHIVSAWAHGGWLMCGENVSFVSLLNVSRRLCSVSVIPSTLISKTEMQIQTPWCIDKQIIVGNLDDRVTERGK